jgi:hypothetical protein
MESTRFSTEVSLMRLIRIGIIALAGLMAAPLAAQDYHLVEPSGVITADVYFQRGSMIVNDADGNQYRFVRDPSFDSINGRYAGFWLPGLNRVVRFPNSGRGLMQVADLDDVWPRYIYSRRSVRPVGRPRPRPPWHAPGYAFVPPVFFGPYGYPRFGYGYYSQGLTLGVGPLWPGPAIPRRYDWRPQSFVLDSHLVPRNPLPPVNLRLVNSAPREIRVTVRDLEQPSQSQQLRITPGESAPIQVQRDAGADLVRRVLTYTPGGSEWIREVVTPLPPQPRYELIVHEWRLQSIAIDRTGKSPNVIEDTNYQGRGLGRFLLPPGDQLQGGSLDVVQAALDADNPGSVAPLLEDADTPQQSLRPLSPLERMLQQQREAGRRP